MKNNMHITNYINKNEEIDKYNMGYTPLELLNCPYCSHWDTKFKLEFLICSQCNVQQPEVRSFRNLRTEGDEE